MGLAIFFTTALSFPEIDEKDLTSFIEVSSFIQNVCNGKLMNKLLNEMIIEMYDD